MCDTAKINRKQNFFYFLFILLGSFLVYGKTLGYDFVWDDLVLIVDNEALRKWSNLGAFFTTPFFKLASGIDFPHHRPMVPLLILMTSAFSGTNPFGYHLLNVTLNAVSAWVFYLFLQKIDLRQKVRILATGIFLFHPAHVEVVAWPCCATVLLSGICFLTGLILSSGMSARSGSRPVWSLLGVAAAYAAGLMSYDLVLFLPVVIFLTDWLCPVMNGKGKKTKFRVLECVVLGLAGLGFLWIRYHLASQMGGFARFQHGDPNATNVILSGAAFEPVFAALNVVTRYMETLVFPLALSPEAYFGAEQFSSSAIASFVLFLLLSVLVLKQTKGNKNPFIFSLAWISCTGLPLIQLIFQGGLFADRYIYFSSMGFALWFGIVLNHFWELAKIRWRFLGRGTAITAAAILFLGYGITTFDQSKIWRDDLTFWTAASILSPQKPRAQHLLGVSLLRFGYPEEAIKAFQKAIQLSPEYPHPYKGIALALRALGKKAEADQADQIADQKYQLQTQMLLKGQPMTISLNRAQSARS